MKKVIWLVISGLMALSLVLAACGQAAPQPAPATPSAPTTPPATPVPTAPPTPTTPTAPTSEKPQQTPTSQNVPQYGGTLLRVAAADPTPLLAPCQATARHPSSSRNSGLATGPKDQREAMVPVTQIGHIPSTGSTARWDSSPRRQPGLSMSPQTQRLSSTPFAKASITSWFPTALRPLSSMGGNSPPMMSSLSCRPESPTRPLMSIWVIFR